MKLNKRNIDAVLREFFDKFFDRGVFDMKKGFRNFENRCYLVVDHQGLEPWARWLRVSCSTNWASGPNKYQLFSLPFTIHPFRKNWWRWLGSNQWHYGYEPYARTDWATPPFVNAYVIIIQTRLQIKHIFLWSHCQFLFNQSKRNSQIWIVTAFIKPVMSVRHTGFCDMKFLHGKSINSSKEIDKRLL